LVGLREWLEIWEFHLSFCAANKTLHCNDISSDVQRFVSLATLFILIDLILSLHLETENKNLIYRTNDNLHFPRLLKFMQFIIFYARNWKKPPHRLDILISLFISNLSDVHSKAHTDDGQMKRNKMWERFRLWMKIIHEIFIFVLYDFSFSISIFLWIYSMAIIHP
jgi:hypothetical protein